MADRPIHERYERLAGKRVMTPMGVCLVKEADLFGITVSIPGLPGRVFKIEWENTTPWDVVEEDRDGDL